MTSTTQKGIRCRDVDVAMIVYNEADLISRCLTSLMAAGFETFTILDMNSTDGTVAAAKDLLGDRCTVHVVSRRYLMEHGYAAARNLCAAFCEKKWILFVDADEILTGGTENGFIKIDQVGPNDGLYAIERFNLSIDPQGSQERYVRTVEHHNRLYQPKFWQKWLGYIHEEIHSEDKSGHTFNGHSALKFDHYSELKRVVDVDRKNGLYALMLLRAFNNPAVQVGTNPWWFDSYVPEHLPTLAMRAQAFADAEGIPRSFYDPQTVSQPTAGLPVLFKPFTESDPGAEIAAHSALRTLHTVKGDRWTGSPSRVLWFEWNHPGETSRPLASLMAAAEAFNWPRFIKPGRVAIDIGGHSADTAIPMGLLCYDKDTGTKGHVIVVEPNPAVIPVMDCNLAINTHIANFYSVAAAITAHDMDEIELADHGNSQCNGGVLQSGLSTNVAQKLEDAAEFRYTARGISMDTLFTEAKKVSGGQPIGFVKLDCEGYDKEILRPCAALLEQDKPILFVEWFDWFEDEDDIDLFAVIDSLGYVPFDPVTLQPSSLDRPTSDILCVHKSLLGPDGLPPA